MPVSLPRIFPSNVLPINQIKLIIMAVSIDGSGEVKLLENRRIEGVRDGGQDAGAVAGVVVARAGAAVVQPTG